jgi:hypothetical protein
LLRLDDQDPKRDQAGPRYPTLLIPATSPEIV